MGSRVPVLVVLSLLGPVRETIHSHLTLASPSTYVVLSAVEFLVDWTLNDPLQFDRSHSP